MKLTSETISVLKNFVQINQSILVRKGRPLRTISQRRNVFASYKAEEVFDRDFAIYDLAQWLSVVTLFNAPEIHLEEKHMVISQGKRRVKYTYAEPSMIIAAPDSDPNLSDTPTIDFELKADVLQEINKASSVLQAPYLEFRTNRLVVKDIKNPSSNEFTVEDITMDPSNESLLTLSMEHARLFNTDYRVEVFQGRKISRFTGTTKPISYLISGLSNA